MKSSSRVQAFFDKETFTLTYVVWDESTGDAVIIDPVLGFDSATQMLKPEAFADVERFVVVKGLRVHWILETHAHADHLTSGRELKARLPGSMWGMGARMGEVFENFRKAFAWPASLKLSALGVDRFFNDGEEFTAGSLKFRAFFTPGHTPACLTYQVDDMLFTGDAIFMPDSGTGRCDFPGGNAGALYDGIVEKIYSLPDDFKIFVGHDYQPGGRALRYQTTVGEQKRLNIHLKAGTSREEFIKFREGRDKTLSAPRLLNPSLDWNLGAHQIVIRS